MFAQLKKYFQQLQECEHNEHINTECEHTHKQLYCPIGDYELIVREIKEAANKLKWLNKIITDDDTIIEEYKSLFDVKSGARIVDGQIKQVIEVRHYDRISTFCFQLKTNESIFETKNIQILQFVVEDNIIIIHCINYDEKISVHEVKFDFNKKHTLSFKVGTTRS